MRLLWGLGGVVALIVGLGSRPHDDGVEIVVLGDIGGYLSPCGCSDPMTGGILRQASLLKRLKLAGATVVVSAGGLVDSTSRQGVREAQNVLKSEALAEIFQLEGVDAVNVAFDDARVGPGEFFNLESLSGKRFVAGGLAPGPANPFSATESKHGFSILGMSRRDTAIAAALGVAPLPFDETISEFCARANSKGEKVVLLFDGSKQEAEEVARKHGSLAVIAYRLHGHPPLQPESVGSTLLVSAGDRGQYVVTLKNMDSQHPNYAIHGLGPEIEDNPDAKRVYLRYLKRVGQEGLWDKWPKVSGPAFSGSARCGRCHAAAYRVWNASGHRQAFDTLRANGHDLDPECLPCHVTGPAYKSGFLSNVRTPLLATVGCESCHGAGTRHSAAPRKFRLRPAGAESCNTCHEPLNSPKFDFAKYWARIRH